MLKAINQGLPIQISGIPLYTLGKLADFLKDIELLPISMGLAAFGHKIYSSRPNAFIYRQE